MATRGGLVAAALSWALLLASAPPGALAAGNQSEPWSRWVQSEAGNKFFLVGPTTGKKYTWDEAEADCQAGGGHLASPTSPEVWADIGRQCEKLLGQPSPFLNADGSRGKADGCWVGARQLDFQRTPAAGWVWADCKAEAAYPFAKGISDRAVQWRSCGPKGEAEAYLCEPNDYDLVAKQAYLNNTPDGNRENCGKLALKEGSTGTVILDFVCGNDQPGWEEYGTQTYVCMKPRGCHFDANSDNGWVGNATRGCSCRCRAGYTGDGVSACCDNDASTYDPFLNACVCKVGFSGPTGPRDLCCATATAAYDPVTEACVSKPSGSGGAAEKSVKKSSKAKVAVGASTAGAAVLIVLLTVCCCWLVLLRRRKRQQKSAAAGSKPHLSGQPDNTNRFDAEKAHVAAHIYEPVTVPEPQYVALPVGTPRTPQRPPSSCYSSASHASYLPTSVGSVNSGVSGSSGGLAAAKALRVRSVTYQEVERACNGFAESSLLGSGGFGKVYFGVLASGEQVAVKRLAGLSRGAQGEKEFYNEVEILARTNHKNLVSLIGFCEDRGQHMLLYEYVPMGSLHDHLYPGEDRPVLPWLKRLQLAVGAARGLHYLHCAMNEPIIHRDVKPANILVDANFEAKVSDFGLSRLMDKPEDLYQTTGLETNVKGTLTYLDPAYLRTQILTPKSDTYSFGVVLLELVTGRHPVHRRAGRTFDVITWARELALSGDALATLDLGLKSDESVNVTAVEKVARLAAQCTSQERVERPDMAAVLHELEEALAVQQSQRGLVVVK